MFKKLFQPLRPFAPAAVVALAASSSGARADDDLALRLAQLFVSEAGFEGERDHAAIWWALHNRAEATDREFMEHMKLYSWPLWRPQNSRARWITSLRADGGEPKEPGPPWRARLSDAWKEMLERARSYLVTAPANPCRGRQEHWGGRVPVDRERASRALGQGRWRLLRCGTRNQFFEVVR